MKVYVVDINEFNDLEGFNLISQMRKERMIRYRSLNDRKRSLVAGLLLRYTLKEEHNNIKISRDGKPYLENSNVYFNFSHSKDYVCLNISSKSELGIDIEKIKQYPDRVSERCFNKNEIKWMLKEDNVNHAFFKLWTGKESVMKLFGRGFKMNPKSIDLMPIKKVSRLVEDKEIFLKWIDYDGYLICSSSYVDTDIEFIRLNKLDLLNECYY